MAAVPILSRGTVDSSRRLAQYCAVMAGTRPILFGKGRSPVTNVSGRGLHPMKTLVLLILIPLAVAVGASRASAQSCTTATCTAATPGLSDFLAALPSRSNTNATVTVNIPAGSATWSGGSFIDYIVPSAVTTLIIQGATTVSCTGTAGTSGYSCTATDGTIISDAITTNDQLVITTGSASTYLRITGLTFQGTATGAVKYGTIQIFGSSHNVRIDHNHFNISGYPGGSFASAWVRFYGPELGVVDHNVLDMGPNLGTTWNGIQVDTTVQAFDDSIGNGDGTFQNLATPWGTADFIYVENNQLNGGYGNDCAGAGLIVMRYNTFNGATLAMQNHATKSPAGPTRGCRAMEFYHNYDTGTANSNAMIGMKGTTALVWGNTDANSANAEFWGGSTDRNSGAEIETKTPNGWGYCGTAILSNLLGSAWDGNSNILTGYPCLDGLGRGQTTQALNGQNFPNRLNSTTGTIAWPHQYLEPIYLWMNAYSTTALSIKDSITTQNVDIFKENSGCGGSGCSSLTTGTGYGTLAQRPATCTAGPGGTYYTSPTGSYGVAYWATDANSGQGELYVCTATNTWTPIYEPYIYPHPLTAGDTQTSGDPPSPPSDLTASVE